MKKIKFLLLTLKGFKKWSFFKTIHFNFFSGKVKTDKNSFIFISRKTKLELFEHSKIILNNSIVEFDSSYYDVYVGSRITLGKDAKWVISGKTRISGACINLWQSANLETKKMVVNCMTKINIQNRATFGDNVMIARHCYVTDTNSHHIFKNGTEKKQYGKLTIGNNVWICTNSVILKDTNINDEAIISCNSVISGEIPTRKIAGNKKEMFFSDIDSWFA